MKEKGIKVEDIKNLPPIEAIHGLDALIQVVEVNSLYRFDEGDIPYTKSDSQCLDELDKFIVKQENFNIYVSRQLKRNAYMIERLSDYMFRIVNDLKVFGKLASMLKNQVERVLKAQKICSMR